MSGNSGELLVDYTRVLSTFLHAGLWVHWAPGIPHALSGRNEKHNPGEIAPRDRGLISLNVIARSDSDDVSAVAQRAKAEAIQLVSFAQTKPDCFAEPVIGRRFAPTRWLAMTISGSRNTLAVILRCSPSGALAPLASLEDERQARWLLILRGSPRRLAPQDDGGGCLKFKSSKPKGRRFLLSQEPRRRINPLWSDTPRETSGSRLRPLARSVPPRARMPPEKQTARTARPDRSS